MKVEVAYNGRRKTVTAAAGAGLMLREIYQHYHLPMMPDTLTLEDLRFWYDPLIESLAEMQRSARDGRRKARK